MSTGRAARGPPGPARPGPTRPAGRAGPGRAGPGRAGPGRAGPWLAAGRAGPGRRLVARTFQNFRQDLGKSSNCCHQMMDFKAKMHQIRFRLGLRPRPLWGSLLQRSPRPPSWIWGAASRQEEGLGKMRERGGEGRQGNVEGREREGPQVTVEPGPLRALLLH